MINRILLVLLVALSSCLVTPWVAHAQPSGHSQSRRPPDPVATAASDWAVRFDYQTGSVPKTLGSARDFYHAYRVEFVRQTDGSQDWHHAYHFPAYGLGVHVGDFGTGSTERGVPVSIYGFLQVPLLRFTKTTDVITNVGFGVTLGWNAPGRREDPFATRPTSFATSYLDLGFYLRQRVTRRVDLIGGYSMSHFSNGGTRSPNKGLTIKDPRIVLQYSLGDRAKRPPRSRLSFEPHWVTRVDGGVGLKGVGVLYNGKRLTPRGRLGVGILKGSVWRRFFRNGQVGGGAEISYEGDREWGDALLLEADRNGGASVGTYIGYEQLFGPVSFYAHVGAYLIRTRKDERPISYERVGVVYRFSEHWFSDFGLRFYGYGSDDYVDWTVGYRFDGLP